MRILHHKNGFALAFSMIFFFLIISFVGAFILVANHGLTIAKKSSDIKKAYYAADAGLADALIQLRAYASLPTAFNVNNSNYLLGGSQTASYSVAAVSNNATWPTFTLTSKGIFNGASKTLVLTVQQTAVSTFAYLSNTEIHPTWGALWWITGMTTVGPVRTNGALNIWGNPIYNGTVVQGGAAVNYYNGGPPKDNPNFVNGFALNAPTVAFPATTMLNSVSSAASSGGIFLTGNSTVIFNSNGTINVTNTAKGWSNKNMSLPSNGVIYVQTGTVTVQGTIKGQATVASDSQVYISGSLSYNTNPRTNPTSTDMLGLVSKNDITVLANSAPSNLELDAAMVAINGAFQVDQWWLSGKGNMIQYGSLVNNYCGPTGQFDPGTGVLYGGYNQLQYYDPRLLTTIPPGFPPAVDSTGRDVYVKISFKEL
ncbi:MAG: hypothetical protein WCH62_01380 [Candidatus Omnitrophota bacterium]